MTGQSVRVRGLVVRRRWHDVSENLHRSEILESQLGDKSGYYESIRPQKSETGEALMHLRSPCRGEIALRIVGTGEKTIGGI